MTRQAAREKATRRRRPGDELDATASGFKDASGGLQVHKGLNRGGAATVHALHFTSTAAPREPTMNTPLAHRLAAAVAAIAVAAMLFSTVFAQATPSVPGSLLAAPATVAGR